MKVSLSMICFLVGLSLMSLTGGIARGQEERGELPEGIRQLIRAAELAEQQAKREGGTANAEAERKAKEAHAAARRAISDFYAARFEYRRALDANEIAKTAAEKADAELIRTQNEAIPNPPRQEQAKVDRDDRLRALAESEINVEEKRQAFNSASNPSGSATGGSATGGTRGGVPPALPVPDYGTQRPGGGGEAVAPYVTAFYGCRYVYRNGEGSFQLANQSGTAYYTRLGQPHVVTLQATRETPNFFWYQVVSGDSTVIEWAFAKAPEIPGLDCTPRYAVWCHDRAGWHWEWSHRDAVCDYLNPGAAPMQTVPMTTPRSPVLLPGPATYILPTMSQPIVLVSDWQ